MDKQLLLAQITHLKETQQQQQQQQQLVLVRLEEKIEKAAMLHVHLWPPPVPAHAQSPRCHARSDPVLPSPD